MWIWIVHFLFVAFPKYSGDKFVMHQPERKGREDGKRNAKGIIRQWEATWRRVNKLGRSSGNSCKAPERS